MAKTRKKKKSLLKLMKKHKAASAVIIIFSGTSADSRRDYRLYSVGGCTATV